VPRSLGPRLPENLRPLFDGSDLEERVGLTFLLLTCGEDGWLHQAMLAVGEVVAVREDTLRVALWLTSTATRNLTREGRAVLTLVADGAGYVIRCTARRLQDLDLGPHGRLAAFVLPVEDVLEDRVSYATLTSGVRFELNEPEQVLDRWRRTIDALLAMDGANS
jgi:hypothetical protein